MDYTREDWLKEATILIERDILSECGVGLVATGWSNNEGDSWGAHPADSEFVEGLKVGDEYELLASANAWTERFRVVKAPDDTGDDYEVELVSIRTV